jgi:hypothetical protein
MKFNTKETAMEVELIEFRRKVYAWMVFVALCALTMLPFVVHGQVLVKRGKVAQVFMMYGDTVALVPIGQIRQSNVLFNDRRLLRYENGSLRKENALLRSVISHKDTAYLLQQDIIKVKTQEIVVRTQQEVDYKQQLQDLKAADDKVIRKLRVRLFGCGVAIGGLVYLLFR